MDYETTKDFAKYRLARAEETLNTAETIAKNRYNAKAYDQIPLRVKAGEKEKIQAHAQQKGMSLNAYIVGLIEKDMKTEEDT